MPNTDMKMLPITSEIIAKIIVGKVGLKRFTEMLYVFVKIR
jgi:hypothetical protein